MAIRLKRVYEPPSARDGVRIFVERLWPRGLSKEKAHVDRWVKDVAPSTELRQWFKHDPAKWEAFKTRYWAELDQRPAIIQELVELAQNRTVTLVYAASDTQHNNAVALKEYLERRMSASS